METNHPLVSIIIVTYNSECTIVETLDSAINQSYDNVEIIISDDCSKDNTVNVVLSWIEQNASSFRGKIRMLTSEANQGVCKNSNKAIRNSLGEYIKIIAGDDKLLPDCCKDYVNFVNENPEAHFVTSFVQVYNNTFEERNRVDSTRTKVVPSVFSKPADVQLKMMAFYIFVSAPTMFFSRQLYDKVGGFDEHYLYEDHPFYINILEAGEKIYMMPKESVAYRIHESSYNSNQKLFNYNFSRSSRKFRAERCYKYYGFRQKIATEAYYSILTIFEQLHLNKKTKFMQSVYHAITGAIWAIGK